MSKAEVLEVPKQHKQPSDRRSSNNSFIETKLPNGSIYKGQFQNGKMEGRGILTYANKQRYEGEFHNGMKHGKGKYYYLKGQLYIGDWFENKKQGKGLYFYENGNRYNGQFKDNMKHGKGRIDEEDGSYFIGEFYENSKDKTGQYLDGTQQKKYLQVYDRGIQISSRQIIQIPDIKQSQKIDLPQLLRIPSKNIQKAKQLQQLQIASQQQKIKEMHSRDLSTPDKPFATHGHSQLSLRQLYFDKKKSSQKQKKGQIILQHYFDKELIQKRSINIVILVNQWSKQDVSQWLNQIGFGDCIQEFKGNNITGESLFALNNSDLKQLHVAALGDRKILLKQIDFLKLIFKSQCLGDPISKLFHRQVNLRLVRDLEKKKSAQDSKNRNDEQNAADGTDSSSTGSEAEIEQYRQERAKMNMQRKIQSYMVKKGIRLTFLIPKDQIQIIKPIGKGGYGQVYLGRWLGQDVAVKKYTKKQGFRNRHIGNFIQEVQVITKLLHPYIVLYMGMCIYDNQYIMVTQFLSGGSLFDFLHKRGQKLNEQRIFYICKDVALGMSYLHGKNVLHCDLKSSNVLIDQNWNVKLCDFGLSRLRDNKKNRKGNIRVGTPHWMAPQILKGQKFQFYSDVYSFGILLWEMLTGQIPYKQLSTAQIINLVGNDNTHHIAIPNYPNDLFLKIFLCCTERDPQKRPNFKSIVQLLQKQEHKYQSVEQYEKK